MSKRRLQSRLQGIQRNKVPVINAGPVSFTTTQCCMHRPRVKCVQANACPCRAAICPCKSGCPSGNCRNRGPTRAPTAPRLTTNVSETIEEAQEAAPIIYQAIDLVVFHQDVPAFSPSILPRGDDWPGLPVRADTAYAAPALTNTAAPAAVGSGKTIQIAHDQRTVKFFHPVRPTT